MSRFTRMATTSQTLSLTAMEEASRRGLRKADLQDLFLALVLDDEAAGQVLRDQGITITSARRAVEENQQQQIASLGISVDLPPSDRIVFHETAGYNWSKRAVELLRRAAARKSGGYAANVLRELLEEPSGLVTELLLRVDTSRENVAAGLDRAFSESPPERTGRGGRGAAANHATRVFVPAPVDDVWTLLTDPRRVPEWDVSLGSVEVDDPDSSEFRPGTTWIVRASTEHPDGKPIKVRRNFSRRSVELVELLHRDRVVWRTAHPDAHTSVPFLTAFDLAPATGGTRLTITMSWQRRRGWRAVVGFLLAPAQRFLLWIRLTQIGAAISRVFRQP